MRIVFQRWKYNFLLLSIWLPGVFTLGVSSVIALEISNTAVFGGDGIGVNGIGVVNTNRTSLTAQVPTLQITKTADRAAAEPGDTVIYRIAIRNTGNVAASNLALTDTLPLGMRFEGRSVQASLNNTPVNVSATSTNPQGRSVTINFAGSIPAQGILNVAYAVTLTPDAIRGTGRNLAVANAGNIRSNTASHQLRIRPGIVSNCGTLIGKVFVDKNFDGEQQAGEPGIPNAVVFMDDGNRIITDINGMFSVANVIAGNRTGTIDLTSLPGYSLAPNRYRIEKNSQSRLVKLAPRGMARMNFAVTPAFGEGRQ